MVTTQRPGQKREGEESTLISALTTSNMASPSLKERKFNHIVPQNLDVPKKPEKGEVTVELKPVVGDGKIVEVPIHNGLLLSFIIKLLLLFLLHFLFGQGGVPEEAGFPNSNLSKCIILTVRPGKGNVGLSCFHPSYGLLAEVNTVFHKSSLTLPQLIQGKQNSAL